MPIWAVVVILVLFYMYMSHPDSRPSGAEVAAFDEVYYR
jgi:hypothetical protein